MNSSAAEPQGPIRTPLPNPLPFGRGEGEATPRSLSALIQRQWGRGEGSDLGFRDAQRVRMAGGSLPGTGAFPVPKAHGNRWSRSDS